MNRPVIRQLPARVNSRSNFGEYDNIDRRVDLDYSASMEIFSLQNRAAKSEERLNMIDSKFESLISEIHSLRWWVLGVVIGGVITTIGAMICFAQLQGTWVQDSINAREASTDRQIEDMRASWQAINAEQQKRFDETDKRWQAINAEQQKRFDETDKRWQAINAEQQKRFEIMLDRIEKRTDKLERAKN